MCLAVPARIVERNGLMATVELGGVTREVSLMLLPEAKKDDFVLIHAGFAIQTVDEEEAGKTLALLKELAGYDERE